MKKVWIFLIVASVGICAIGVFASNAMRMAAAGQKPAAQQVKVTRGDLVVSVVDSGTVQAVKSVEVKSRVSGRLAQLYVEEGDFVKAGQLIATIDPLETRLQVEQDRAQLAGARSSVAKAAVDMEQRRQTARAEYQQALARLNQLQQELNIQPTLTNLAIREAEAELSSRQRDRENLVQSQQPNQITSARRAVDEAQASYDNAVLEYDRQSALLKEGFTPRKSVESAKLQVDLMRVQLQAAKENQGRLESQFAIERRKADEAVRIAEAAVARAKANTIQNVNKREEYRRALADVDKARAGLRDVDSMRLARQQELARVSQLSSVLSNSERQLRETEIRSPITGVVTKKMLQVGELATGLSGFSSGTGIVKIEDRTTLMVKLTVNEIDVAKMREDLTAKVTVDALPSKAFQGYVKKIAPASTAEGAATGQQAAAGSDAVVKYEVEIYLQESDPKLRSGMSAKCNLEVIRRNQVLLVPREYLGQQGDKRFLMISAGKDPKAKPIRKDVVIGAESGANIEIVSGVSEGEVLVKPDFSGPERKGFMQMGPDDEQ